MKTRLTIADIERLRKLRLPPDDQERISRYQMILERAGSELRELAEESHSSVSLAADALASKFMTMARLKALSDTEVKQLLLPCCFASWDARIPCARFAAVWLVAKGS
jgi:hypothetical protein